MRCVKFRRFNKKGISTTRMISLSDAEPVQGWYNISESLVNVIPEIRYK